LNRAKEVWVKYYKNSKFRRQDVNIPSSPHQNFTSSSVMFKGFPKQKIDTKKDEFQRLI